MFKLYVFVVHHKPNNTSFILLIYKYTIKNKVIVQDSGKSDIAKGHGPTEAENKMKLYKQKQLN